MPAELPTSVVPFDNLPDWSTMPLTKAPPELDPADGLREEDEDIMVRHFRGSRFHNLPPWGCI